MLKLKNLPKLKFKLKLVNAYVVSTLSIIFVLLLTGMIFLLVFNGRKIVKNARESIQLIVIIKPNVKQTDILLFQKELERKPFVKNTDYISKQEGLEEMKAYLGSDIVDVLDFNPLPPIIKVNLKSNYTKYNKLQQIIQWLSTQPVVDDVFFNKSLVYQLNKNIRFISTVLSVVAILLTIIALNLINNTIRLTIHSKRQEIKTMQLVGASDWFILKPFLLNSVLQGLFAGLVADAVIILSLIFVQYSTKIQFEIYGLDLTLIFVILTGVLITGLATYFAVKNFLWAEDKDIFV